jgi:hypothetical protein
MPNPSESKEFKEDLKWSEKSRKKLLKPSQCISCWTDICGFGSLLNKNNWDLNNLQENGFIHLLNEFHSIAGKPLMIGVDPFPNEKIIILNDGIARTIDLTHKDKLEGILLLFYLRDLITTHFRLLSVTKDFGVGIRTILAGGERIQYSSPKTTGESFLHYDKDNVSEFGKKILKTTYVYNPSEFQMNTAFAKAFTIDSIGTKGNIKVNGFYIEKSFLENLKDIKGFFIKEIEDKIEIYRKQEKVFELIFSEKFKIDLKGIEVLIYHITNFKILKEFDGDDIEVSLFR